MAMMLLGRIIAGFSVGLLSGNAPVYTSEIAPPTLRGALVTGFQFAITAARTHQFCLDKNLKSQSRHLKVLCICMVFFFTGVVDLHLVCLFLFVAVPL